MTLPQPLTEWPDEDAPVSEWARPLSATITNIREQPGTSSGTHRGHNAGGAWAISRRLAAREKIRERK